MPVVWVRRANFGFYSGSPKQTNITITFPEGRKHFKHNSMYRALIVEDEMKGLANLQAALEKHCPEVDVIATADSIESAKALFDESEFEIDLAFLDINLPDGMVFRLLDEIQPLKFDVIFVTAFDEFAIRACEYANMGYITKPIDAEKLIGAVARVQPRDRSVVNERMEVFRDAYFHPNAFRKIAVSALDGTHFIELGDIMRLEAEDNYTHLHLRDGSKMTASKTIKKFESKLERLNFYRVHKRHMVNMNFMQKFVKGDGGYLLMNDGKKIEVSRRRRPAFMTRIKRLEEDV